MMFDPHTASEEEALAQPDALDFPWSPYKQWEAVQVLHSNRSKINDDPLTGLAICLSARISIPQWLSESYLRRYSQTKSGVFRTWEEAFGVAHPKGAHIAKPRVGSDALKNWPPFRNAWLKHMFSSNGKLPKTRKGKQEAAKRLAITEKEVRDLLPELIPQRPYKLVKEIVKPPDTTSVGTAHNPFGMKGKKDHEI